MGTIYSVFVRFINILRNARPPAVGYQAASGSFSTSNDRKFPGSVYLTDDVISQLLEWDMLISGIEHGLRAVSAGKAVQPPRSMVHIPKGVLLTMPGFSPDDKALACKLVTSFPDNAKNGLPSIMATIALFCTETGKVMVMMDGVEITARRTAAASVVATKYLRKSTDILAILGCGTQGTSHAIALDHAFNFKEIRTWNRTFKGAETLANKLQGMGKNAVACTTGEEAVKDADVIVTATYATSPILERVWVKPDAHINVVGAGITHHSELDEELYRVAEIYTDTMDGAKIELKGLGDMGVTIVGEIGQVIMGEIQPHRDRITVYHSLGMAVEDVIAAKLAYEEYKKRQQ